MYYHHVLGRNNNVEINKRNLQNIASVDFDVEMRIRDTSQALSSFDDELANISRYSSDVRYSSRYFAIFRDIIYFVSIFRDIRARHREVGRWSVSAGAGLSLMCYL